MSSRSSRPAAPGGFPGRPGAAAPGPGNSPVHRAGRRPYRRSVHSEHAGGHDTAEYGERAETYLRLLAETALREAVYARAEGVWRAAETLVDAGVLTDELAGQILAGLQLAFRVRGRRQLSGPALRLRRLAGFRPGQALGQSGEHPRPWRILPAGPATPGSRVMALILTADRAVAPATLFFPPLLGPPESGIPAFAALTGTDDLGTSYRLGFTDGTWAGSTWTGTVLFRPAPPEAARWLSISSPNGPLLRADIPDAPAGTAAPGMVPEPVTESPGERLLARHAEAMLAGLPLGSRAGPSRRALGETVATLEAAGALSPLSPAPAQLAALCQLLGVPSHDPAEATWDMVPARWTDVVARYGRRRRPPPVTGTAAIGAGLPELDGTRFAIAGLRSGSTGTFLYVLVQGLRRPITRSRPPGPAPDPMPVRDTAFSWWARDDAGGWHVGTVEDASPISGPEGVLRLALLPPLDHPTGTLTVEVSGLTTQVTADLPVRW